MFEIEHMNETFDYSLIDNDTAEFLKEREYTINGIAEDARIKIGKELKKHKTNSPTIMKVFSLSGTKVAA